ncbi:uncharacterized protein LOC143290813 [Babylonia areolata]|uniref:uncharacterized protein LOC143290813 n=1 Tax=Babylonia areolata TaxID=304850 RepID=UPI003FD50BD2
MIDFSTYPTTPPQDKQNKHLVQTSGGEGEHTCTNGDTKTFNKDGSKKVGSNTKRKSRRKGECSDNHHRGRKDERHRIESDCRENCVDKSAQCVDKGVKKCVGGSAKCVDEEANYCVDETAKECVDEDARSVDGSARCVDEGAKKCVDESGKCVDKSAKNCVDKPPTKCVDESAKNCVDKPPTKCVDESAKKCANAEAKEEEEEEEGEGGGDGEVNPLSVDLYDKLCAENRAEEVLQWDTYLVGEDLRRACKKLSCSEKHLYVLLMSLFMALTFAMVFGLCVLQAQVSMNSKEILSKVQGPKKAIPQGMYTLYYDYLDSGVLPENVDLRANTSIFVH